MELWSYCSIVVVVALGLGWFNLISRSATPPATHDDCAGGADTTNTVTTTTVQLKLFLRLRLPLYYYYYYYTTASSSSSSLLVGSPSPSPSPSPSTSSTSLPLAVHHQHHHLLLILLPILHPNLKCCRYDAVDSQPRGCSRASPHRPVRLRPLRRRRRRLAQPSTARHPHARRREPAAISTTSQTRPALAPARG